MRRASWVGGFTSSFRNALRRWYSTVRVPAGMGVRRYVPHVTVLPHAALVVTHAGTGTLMAAFSHAVPLVCIPLGRDQPGNAARAAELGVALALPSDAGPDQIRAAVSEALGSASLRSSSEWMAAAIAVYGAGSRAVQEVEALAVRSIAGLGWRA